MCKNNFQVNITIYFYAHVQITYLKILSKLHKTCPGVK